MHREENLCAKKRTTIERGMQLIFAAWTVASCDGGGRRGLLHCARAEWKNGRGRMLQRVVSSTV